MTVFPIVLFVRIAQIPGLSHESNYKLSDISGVSGKYPELKLLSSKMFYHLLVVDNIILLTTKNSILLNPPIVMGSPMSSMNADDFFPLSGLDVAPACAFGLLSLIHS